MIKAFFIALGLMTRIPIPSRFQINDADNEKLYGWSVLFYPLIGIIVSGVLIFILWCLTLIPLSTNGLVEAAIILITWVLITGALHLDGLADSSDAWLGGYGNKDRTLEIMKDPCSGPAAVVILVLVLLLKFSSLTILSINEWILIALSPVLARTSVMILLATTPYVRKGGMGESAVKKLPKTTSWIVLIIVLSTSVFFLKEKSWGLLVLFAIAYFLRRLMLKRIGGTTGDTAGAMVEVMEVSVLVVFILTNNI